jgi:hypothetical protein
MRLSKLSLTVLQPELATITDLGYELTGGFFFSFWLMNALRSLSMM